MINKNKAKLINLKKIINLITSQLNNLPIFVYMEIRNYKVGGHIFSVRLEFPWKFMQYTGPVQSRIDAAACGDELDIKPTRAGDSVPARTFVQSRGELPENMDNNTLDFSQYEPFHTVEPADLFTFKVCAEEPQWLAAEKAAGHLKLLIKVDDVPPCYYIYDLNGETIFEFDADRGHIAGVLKVSKDYKSGEYYPKKGFSPYTTLFQVSTALMMMYTYNAATRSTLLTHSSVVRHNGLANMFLGTSGTGKSTHSRLWLGNIEGCDLINDDNPVVRLESDAEGNKKLFVYGSPWSGKTPCYRNIKVQVRAIVRLEQAPENKIRTLEGIKAYASILASSSCIRWDRTIMDNITATASDIAMGVKCYNLECLPDADAALTCYNCAEN